MAHKIKNVKTIQKKAKGNTVIQLNNREFTVTSGSSKKTYDVTFFGFGAKCTCPWGEHRPDMDKRSGCNHVVSVFNYLEEQDNRKVSCWNNVEDAKRQHRPFQQIGDGVVLTSRLNNA